MNRDDMDRNGARLTLLEIKVGPVPINGLCNHTWKTTHELPSLPILSLMRDRNRSAVLGPPLAPRKIRSDQIPAVEFPCTRKPDSPRNFDLDHHGSVSVSPFEFST